MKTALYHLHALSPVHVGTGQAAGAVDLPIMREKSTHLPLIPGSAIKGVLRDRVQRHDPAAARRLFGPDSIAAAEDAHIGAVAFGDAQLIALPVRTLAGIVALVTSPFLLERYANLAARAGLTVPEVPEVADESIALVPSGSVNTVSQGQQHRLVLEDLDLNARQNDPAAGKWARYLAPLAGAAAQHISKRIVIVHDAVMGFLADTGTEIRPRISINSTKGVVNKGALWYEENLPAESLLAGLLAFDRVAHADWSLEPDEACTALRRALGDEEILLQVGGKATVGRGLVRMLIGQQEG